MLLSLVDQITSGRTGKLRAQTPKHHQDLMETSYMVMQ